MDQIFLVVMIAMMGFLLWNSSRTRKKQAQLLAEQLAVGVEVMLGSGVYGTVESIAADRLVIKSAGSTIEVARGAVARVLPAPAAEPTVSKAATAKKESTPKPVAKPTAQKAAPKKAAAKKAD
ncbi:MAG: Preprotein translocase subunit [Actinomycetota bacterium]|jgi:preprotein translocase subunit YajC|nr:preprotein translocase subunit YajC [Microbacteriaceae bacterium]